MDTVNAGDIERAHELFNQMVNEQDVAKCNHPQYFS